MLSRAAKETTSGSFFVVLTAVCKSIRPASKSLLAVTDAAVLVARHGKNESGSVMQAYSWGEVHVPMHIHDASCGQNLPT